MLRFDQKETKVLAYVHLKADASIAEVASATGLKSHTVRYVLELFTKRGVLQPFVIINRKRLGIENVITYFKIKAAYTDHRASITEALIAYPACCWLSPVIGDLEFGLTLAVKSLGEYHQVMENLSSQLGSFWGERIWASGKAWYYLGKKYLFGSKYSSEPLIVNSTIETIKYDEADFLILSELAKNALVSESQIGKTLGLPSSTISTRIQKLKEKKVIVGYVNGFYYSKAQISAYIVLIDFGGMGESLFSKFFQYVSSHLHVTSFTVCSGCYDVGMSVEFEDTQSINLFLAEFRSIFKLDIAKLVVLSRMDELKWTMMPSVWKQ